MPMRAVLKIAIAGVLALCIPAHAGMMLQSKGAPSAVVSQTIASVPLSSMSFPPSSPSGTVVGVIGTPVMSPSSPAFTGSCCSLAGMDSASFQVSGSNLETQGSLCGSPPVSYSIDLVATQAGISNSPFSQPQTITCSAATITSIVSNPINLNLLPSDVVDYTYPQPVGATVALATT